MSQHVSPDVNDVNDQNSWSSHLLYEIGIENKLVKLLNNQIQLVFVNCHHKRFVDGLSN
jgi:hypothetical protein